MMARAESLCRRVTYSCRRVARCPSALPVTVALFLAELGLPLTIVAKSRARALVGLGAAAWSRRGLGEPPLSKGFGISAQHPRTTSPQKGFLATLPANAHVGMEAAAAVLAGDVVVGKAVSAGAPEAIDQVACVDSSPSCHRRRRVLARVGPPVQRCACVRDRAARASRRCGSAPVRVCSRPHGLAGSRPEQRHADTEHECHHRSVKDGPECALQRGHPLVDGGVHGCHEAGVLSFRLLHDDGCRGWHSSKQRRKSLQDAQCLMSGCSP